MIKIIMCVVSMVLFVSAIGVADPSRPVFEVNGAELSDKELDEYAGRLRIFGVTIFPRLKLFNRRQKAADLSRVHCDIIAQNRAASLGLDTRDQSGSTTDYNTSKVSSIFGGFPKNRSSTPPAGSSGYYFTSYGNEKEHMGAYSRQSGSNTYTRYANRSFPGTERAADVDVGYVPTGVTSQQFVPLPRLSYDETYYR